jgi:hypothetical protein
MLNPGLFCQIELLQSAAFLKDVMREGFTPIPLQCGVERSLSPSFTEGAMIMLPHPKIDRPNCLSDIDLSS